MLLDGINKLKSMFFKVVAWLLMMGGLSESFLCLSQLYGYSVSNHGLYGFTGSFYNPGPCMGFLTICFPRKTPAIGACSRKSTS